MLNDEGRRSLEEALQRLRKAFAHRVSNYSQENPLSHLGEGSSPVEPGVRPSTRPSKVHVQIELSRVDAALARIESGTFGACCRCEIEIDLEWLTEDPAMPFCRSCFNELTTQRQKLRR